MGNVSLLLSGFYPEIVKTKSNGKSWTDICVVSSFLSHHIEVIQSHTLCLKKREKRVIDLTADWADEVLWLALRRKKVMSLIPQPSHVDSACSPCGCLASLLTQSKVMNISMTDNPEGNEHEWLFVFLCGCYSPGSKPAWERLQQSSTYFHLLACVRKRIHICVYFVHTYCCFSP